MLHFLWSIRLLLYSVRTGRPVVANTVQITITVHPFSSQSSMLLREIDFSAAMSIVAWFSTDTYTGWSMADYSRCYWTWCCSIRPIREIGPRNGTEIFLGCTQPCFQTISQTTSVCSIQLLITNLRKLVGSRQHYGNNNQQRTFWTTLYVITCKLPVQLRMVA